VIPKPYLPKLFRVIEMVIFNEEPNTEFLKAIMFDFDDTLINMREASLVAFNKILEKNKLPTITMDEMLSTWDSTWRDVIKSLVPPSVDVNALMKKIGLEYMSLFEEVHIDHSELIPGTIEILDFLREKKIQVSIVSRRSTRAVSMQLKKFSLDDKVHCIIGFDSVHSQKPSPEGLFLASYVFGVEPLNCLVVGDSPSDIKAAKAFGASICAVLTGPYKKEKILREEPDYVIDSVVDLPKIIHRFFRMENHSI
jgi:HAD superfamily hydrolase (TIGR01549 family)